MTDKLYTLSDLEALRERCAKVCDEWLNTFGTYEPTHVSAQNWANDAVKDIAGIIRHLTTHTEEGTK